MTETWPARLAAAGDRAVYNMGVGGYGPVQYARLLSDVLALNPSAVVVMLYLGNDVADAYLHTYGLPEAPAFQTPNPSIGHQLRAADAEETLEDRADRLAFHFGLHRAAPPSWLASFRLYWLLDRVRWAAEKYAASPRTWTDTVDDAADSPFAHAIEHDSLRTVLTVPYRHALTDTTDLRIAEGLRITQAALADLHTRTGSTGVRLLILLLPTKEAVFADAFGPVDATHAALAVQETALHDALMATLAARDIPHIALGPLLHDAVRNGQNPFFESADGHLNPLGHTIVAEQVLRALAPSASS